MSARNNPIPVLRPGGLEEAAQVPVPMAHLTKIRDHLALEQAEHWESLLDAVRLAADGVYSIAVEHWCHRVMDNIALIGPISPNGVPWTALAGQLYRTILEVIEVPLPSEYASIVELARSFYTEAEWGAVQEAHRATCDRILREEWEI